MVLVAAGPGWAAPPPPRVALAVAFEPGAGDEGGGDEAEARAKALFEAGAKAYALGKYEEAVKKFEASYDLVAAPELLFNLGQAYARWYDVEPDPQKLRKARALFRNYVSFVRARDFGDAQAATDALKEIERIDEKLREAELEPVRKQREEDDRARRRKVALGIGLGVVGAAVVAGAVVLGVLLARRSGGGEQPELGTIPATLSRAPVGPALLRF